MPFRRARFTERSRRVLLLAQEEAEHFQHTSISAEHLLLGLLRESGGIGGYALRESGIDYDTAREIVEQLRPPGERAAFSKIDLGDDVKRTLELAVNEAHRLGHDDISTEHLLLGLLKVVGRGKAGNPASMKILEGANLTIRAMRKYVIRLRNDPPPEIANRTEPSSKALNVRVRAEEIADHLQAGLDDGQTLADMTLNNLIALIDEQLGDVPDDLKNTARRLVLVGIVNRILNAPGD